MTKKASTPSNTPRNGASAPDDVDPNDTAQLTVESVRNLLKKAGSASRENLKQTQTAVNVTEKTAKRAKSAKGID